MFLALQYDSEVVLKGEIWRKSFFRVQGFNTSIINRYSAADIDLNTV